MSRVVDVHILQTLPPSCLNRDDANSPKTAIYGGVRRARVSSQAWKRATRIFINNYCITAGGSASAQGAADEQMRASLIGRGAGIRSRRLPTELRKRVVEALKASGTPVDDVRLDKLIEEAFLGLLGKKESKKEADTPEETAAEPEAAGDSTKGSAAKGKASKKVKEPVPGVVADLPYTVFISNSAMDTATRHLVDVYQSPPPGTVNRDLLFDEMKTAHSLDIALFGRMVADTPMINVDASCQVAHAISTHRVASEFDFYTAVDDLSIEEDSGAAMLGQIEFNSATLYRYASVNLDGLGKNLGGDDLVPEAIEFFVKAFALALPTGHQNSFAAQTRPDLVFVSARSDQPMSLVGAFESPVKSGTEGYLKDSVEALAQHSVMLEELYGQRDAGWLASSTKEIKGLGGSSDFPTLCESLKAHVAQWQTS